MSTNKEDLIKKVIFQMQKKYAFPCIKQLNEESIPYAVIKGVMLSKLAYSSFDQRNPCDIDLLIPREYLPQVERILNQNGFVRKDESRIQHLITSCFSHQTLPLVKIVHSYPIIFDCNYDIFWGEYTGKRVSIKDFLAKAIRIPVGTTFINTLAPKEALIQLALHHYKDMNSIYLLATKKCFSINKFADVFHLLLNNIDEISVTELYNTSAEYGIIPYIYYVLFYTEKIFKNALLSKYVKAFRTDEGDYLLNCYGLCETERKEWKCDFKTRLHKSNLLMEMLPDLSKRDIQKIEINRTFFLR